MAFGFKTAFHDVVASSIKKGEHKPASVFSYLLCELGLRKGAPEKILTGFENADAGPLSFEAMEEAISNMSPKELLDFDAAIGLVYGMTPEKAKNRREEVSAIFDELDQRGGGGVMRPLRKWRKDMVTPTMR